MKANRILRALGGNPDADRVVPPTGTIAWLTAFAALAMSFLAVFALALSLAADRLADRWSAELSQTATVRISAPAGQIEAQTRAVLAALETTPGIASARVLAESEQLALLEPWLGPDLPVDTLPLPRLIEVLEDGTGPDAAGLRLRLAAEAPGAVYDDHTSWRQPLVNAADRLRMLAVLSIALILVTVAAIVSLAAYASLAANAQVVGTLRLIGARDVYIARAFVRRFTLRAVGGSLVGTALAMLMILALPRASEDGGFLTGLGFQGTHWLMPLAVPAIIAIIAFWATRSAALRRMRAIP